MRYIQVAQVIDRNPSDEVQACGSRRATVTVTGKGISIVSSDSSDCACWRDPPHTLIGGIRYINVPLAIGGDATRVQVCAGSQRSVTRTPASDGCDGLCG